MSNSAGVRMLQQTTVRLAKGELGLRVMLWKTGKQEAQEAAAQATMASALRETRNSAGVRVLQQTMVRLAKGELGLRVMLSKIGKQEAKEAAAQAALRETRNSAGIRVLQQTMVGLAKGELGKTGKGRMSDVVED